MRWQSSGIRSRATGASFALREPKNFKPSSPCQQTASLRRSLVAMLRPTRSRLLLRPTCMLQHMARMGLRGRAHGTSAGSSGPALTQWGSLGATAEELDQIEEMARQDGENQAQLTLQLAEMGLKMYAMCTRPREWFGDAEWRAEFVEQMREPMTTYARVNHRLLDGCEDAYRGVAEEFCAAEPNFDALVESGAMAPQLAALLQAAATEARSAGQRATVDVSRVNGEVLFVDSMSGSPHGFVATVVFRSKEARSHAPHHATSSATPPHAAAAASSAAASSAAAAASPDAAASSTAAAGAGADARAAVEATTDADAGAGAGDAGGVAVRLP